MFDVILMVGYIEFVCDIKVFFYCLIWSFIYEFDDLGKLYFSGLFLLMKI